MKMAVRQIALCLALLIAAGCAGLRSAAPPGRVHHIVLCWLKEPGNAEQRRQLISAARSFSRIEAVESAAVGEPLMSERAVVDDSFDVALHMTFRDATALDAYEKDPRHVQAVQDLLRPLTARVVVYDFVD